MAQLENHLPGDSMEMVTKEVEVKLLEQRANAPSTYNDGVRGGSNIVRMLGSHPKITCLIAVIFLSLICGGGGLIWFSSRKSSNNSLENTTVIFVNPALTTASEQSTAATQSQTVQPVTTDYSAKWMKCDLEYEGDVSTFCQVANRADRKETCVSELCSSPANINGKWTIQNSNGLRIDAEANGFKVLANMLLTIHIEFSIYHRSNDTVGLNFSINGSTFATCVCHRSIITNNLECERNRSSYWLKDSKKLAKSTVKINIKKVNFAKSDIITVEFIGDDNATCIFGRPSITFTEIL